MPSSPPACRRDDPLEATLTRVWTWIAEPARAAYGRALVSRYTARVAAIMRSRPNSSRARWRPASPRRPALLGVVEQLDHRVRERARVLWRHHEPGGAVLDGLRRAAHVGGHDRQARGHRLEHVVGERLGPRGAHEEVDPAQQRHRTGSLTHEMERVVHAPFAGAYLEPLVIRPAAGHGHRRAWMPCQQRRQRVDQRLDPLTWAQQRDHTDHRTRLTQRRHGGMGRHVPRRRDAVVDHARASLGTDGRGQAPLRLAHAHHQRGERGERSLHESIARALGLALEPARKGIAVRRVQKRGAREGGAGKPRHRSRL